MMTTRSIAAFALVAGVGLALGCGAEQEVEEPATATVDMEEPAVEPTVSPMRTVSTEGEGELNIPDEGATLEPPADPERLPDGVMYCDMGTVHYAAVHDDDGRCDLCGMTLVEKGAEDDTGAGPDAT